MLWKMQEDQSYYQKICTFLSGSFCTSLSGKRQVRELSRQDLRKLGDIPKKNRHQTIRLQMEHISMLSYIQTKWYQLSPASFDLAVPPFFQERSFVSQVYL